MANNSLQALAALARVGSTSVLSLAAAPAKAFLFDNRDEAYPINTLSSMSPQTVKLMVGLGQISRQHACNAGHREFCPPQTLHSMQLEQMRLLHEQQMARQRFDAEQAALQRRYNERQYQQDRNHQLTNNFVESFWGSSF